MNEDELFGLLWGYFPKTALFFTGTVPYTAKDVEELDVYPFVRKNINGQNYLDLISMARKPRFRTLFPDEFVDEVKNADASRLAIVISETEQPQNTIKKPEPILLPLLLDKLQTDVVFNVFEFFILEDTKKFIAEFNGLFTKNGKLAGAYARSSYKADNDLIFRKFMDEFCSCVDVGSYDYDKEAFHWDFSGILAHEKEDRIYSAYKIFAHKYYTFRTIGLEFTLLKGDKTLWPKADSTLLTGAPRGFTNGTPSFGPFKDLPGFFVNFKKSYRELFDKVNGLDFLYKHESDETIEQENRRQMFLKVFGLDPGYNIPLHELFYCFYFILRLKPYSDNMETLGEEFLKDTLALNIGLMGPDFIKTKDSYIRLIENEPETVPKNSAGKTGNIYAPTSLEKLIWQIAGQIGRSYTSDTMKDRLRKWADEILKLLTKENKEKAKEFRMDHWIVWTEEEKEKFLRDLKELNEKDLYLRNEKRKILRMLRSYRKLLHDMHDIILKYKALRDQFGPAEKLENLYNSQENAISTDSREGFLLPDEESRDILRKLVTDNLNRICTKDDFFVFVCDTYLPMWDKKDESLALFKTNLWNFYRQRFGIARNNGVERTLFEGELATILVDPEESELI
jgi:hypothetical protein